MLCMALCIYSMPFVYKLPLYNEVHLYISGSHSVVHFPFLLARFCNIPSSFSPFIKANAAPCLSIHSFIPPSFSLLHHLLSFSSFIFLEFSYFLLHSCLSQRSSTYTSLLTSPSPFLFASLHFYLFFL